MTAKITFRADLCKGCGLCAMVCPRQVMAINEKSINRKGYHIAMVTDESRCLACGACAKMCPDSVITVEKF